MANYTIELSTICESITGMSEAVGYDNLEEIIDEARPLLFSFEYPIYEETHREELESKIISHFWKREIGFETYGLFKLNLMNKLREVMPYYNKMYETAALTYSPLNDVNYTKTHTGQDSTEGTRNRSKTETGTDEREVTSAEDVSDTNNRSSSGTDWNLYSDTPQGSIQNITENNTAYLTNATKDTTSSSDTSTNVRDRDITSSEDFTTSRQSTDEETSEETGTNTWTETMVGKVGTYSISKLIEEYRKAVLNVDLMIIEDLDELFMQLW